MGDEDCRTSDWFRCLCSTEYPDNEVGDVEDSGLCDESGEEGDDDLDDFFGILIDSVE